MKLKSRCDSHRVPNPINDIYDNNIDIIIKYIRTKKILFVNNIKDKIYDLIITNISPSKIMYDIRKKLLSDDMDINDKIIKNLEFPKRMLYYLLKYKMTFLIFIFIKVNHMIRW